MKKVLWSTAAAALFVLTLTGCADNAPAQTEDRPPQAAEGDGAMNATPRGQSALARPWQFPRPPPLTLSPSKPAVPAEKKNSAIHAVRTFARFGPMP